LAQKGSFRFDVGTREQFPRFSIGESLLPQCMAFIEEAGMLSCRASRWFPIQKWRRVSTTTANTRTLISRKNSTPGHGTTFQVQRAHFDKILADEAARFGVDLRYQHEITAVDVNSVTIRASPTAHPEGEVREATAKFLLDASGFGRVLPRLLDLEYPVRLPCAPSLLCHRARQHYRREI
jgi:flavin-dependent dehydrogenase